MNAETISQTLKSLADPGIAEHSQRFLKRGRGSGNGIWKEKFKRCGPRAAQAKAGRFSFLF